MTIEYKDSKRIVSLSSDVSNTPSTEEVNFGSGYTYNSSYFSATGSNGYTFTENASNIDQVMWKDLTTSVVGTKYVMRFPFTLTSFTSHTTSGNNHKQEIGLGASYGTGEDPTHDGFFCRYVQQQGVNEVRFFVLARDGSTKNLSQAYSIGYSSISTPTTWYIELIKNEDVYTLNVYSDSAYSDLLGTATVTQTGITGLRYFNHNIFTQSSNGVSIGSSAGYDIYNGVSSLTNKPTDVQDNSIMVEKDTAKRYWFSKATVVDDDLTTDKGWVSNTSAWTYNASGDYLDFATITRSTTAQQIYLDVHDSDYLGSGNNLSDTAWTARFKIRTGTQSSSTGNVLFYFGFSNNLGDSGTTQQTVTMKMNFNGQANENNMTLSVSRVNFENTSPPARVNSDVYANTNLPYSTDLYMEMTRNGDVFTLKAYSDEYVTQASSTSVASVTVTGISGLQYIKAFNDSEQPQSYTSGGARLYDMEITNGSDTWTFPPTLEDNFPSMSGWVEVVTGGNFQVTGNKLVGETQSGNGGTNGGGIYKDYGLGTFDNSKFVLRCKYQILTQSGGSGNACSLYFGISSTKGDGSASSPNANRDGFAITVTNYAASGMLWNYPNDTTWDNSDTDLSLTPTVADYYLEIARTSPTSVTFTLYSDEYDTVVRTHTQAITADLKDLRYLMFQEWRNSSSNTTKVAVSELKLYNKVSSV